MSDIAKIRYPHQWRDEDSRRLVCLVTIDYGLANGRFEAQTMTVRMANNYPMTTTVLRELPVGTWMAEDRSRQRTLWDRGRKGGTAKEREQRRRERLALERSTAGRPKITDALLVDVADIYRRAHALGNAPTQAVADHFERPRSTAAKWVQRAREEGLLGPTEERRPGEKRPRKAKI